VKEILFVVLGALISIPLSIFSNVWTPKWQAFWAKRSERSRAKNDEKSKAQEHVVAWFAANPTDLNTYLLRQIFSFLLTTSALLVSLLLVVLVSPQPDDQTFPASRPAFLALASLICGFYLGRLNSLLSRSGRLVYAVAKRKGWPVYPGSRLPRRMSEIKNLSVPTPRQATDESSSPSKD